MTHLSDADLLAWRDQGAGRDRVIDHLAVCDDCGARYAEMIRTRPAGANPTVLRPDAFVGRGRQAWRDANARSWRWAAAGLAAAAALALVAVVDRPAARPAGRSEAPIVRGGSLQAIEPVGDARLPLTFRWSSPVEASSYRLEVSDATHVVYAGTTPGDTLEAPPALASRLAPGARYSWRIVALDASGEPLAESPAASFVLGR